MQIACIDGEKSKTLVSFVDRLRSVYPDSVFFILAPWGWPSSDGSVSYYYEGAFADVISKRYMLLNNGVSRSDSLNLPARLETLSLITTFS